MIKKNMPILIEDMLEFLMVLKEKNKDKLHVFLNEEEYRNQLVFRNEFLPKTGDDKYVFITFDISHIKKARFF